MRGVLRAVCGAPDSEDPVCYSELQGSSSHLGANNSEEGQIVEWEKLCELVTEKFDKHQYQQLLKKFEALELKGSVEECQNEFERLAHGIMLYNNGYDDVYFVNRFVTGLKEEIRVVIALHRPTNVDTASALALIQEEELSNLKGKTGVKGFTKTIPDKAKGVEVEGGGKKEDKLGTLRDYRRKNGLCFKCGEKWGPGHKCPPQVSLHVIEELLDVLEVDEQDLDADEVTEVEEVVLAVGHALTSTNEKRRTMKICGKIGKSDVLILIDSSNIGTFISDRLARGCQSRRHPVLAPSS